MDLSAIHLVTSYLHPQSRDTHDCFTPEMIPWELDELICQLGLGEFSSGLTIFTDAERQRRWSPKFAYDAIYKIFELGAWDPGVLDLSDFTNCLVVADSIAGDIFVTCPRFGRTIFELPRLDATIRVVGDSIFALLEYYRNYHALNFVYFEPRPCCRRVTVNFTVRPDIGLAQLDEMFQEAWGLRLGSSSTTTDTDFFQDRFIPALHARVGLYLQEDNRAAGIISVQMTIDRDQVADVEQFARPISLANEFSHQPYNGRPCAHSP